MSYHKVGLLIVVLTKQCKRTCKPYLLLKETTEQHNSFQCSPFLVLDLKEEVSVLLCVDYNRVNEDPPFDVYSVPQADELLDQLGFSKPCVWNTVRFDISAEYKLKATSLVCQFVVLPSNFSGSPWGVVSTSAYTAHIWMMVGFQAKAGRNMTWCMMGSKPACEVGHSKMQLLDQRRNLLETRSKSHHLAVIFWSIIRKHYPKLKLTPVVTGT